MEKLDECKTLEIESRKGLQGLSTQVGQKSLEKFGESTCNILKLTLILLIVAFLSSSAVERSAVNRLVAGSNPAWGV